MKKFKMVDEGSPDSHSTDLNISGEEGHCKTLKKEGRAFRNIGKIYITIYMSGFMKTWLQ